MNLAAFSENAEPMATPGGNSLAAAESPGTGEESV